MIKPILRWVDKQDGPFFISLLTLITHHNYKVPTTFKKKKYPGSQRWSNYLNTVRYTDEFLQELFEGFDDRGLLDNTLFVIIGDHGEGHGEHGRKGHDALIFQEGIHVPYVLWSRKLIPKPVRIKGNRLNIDLAPTVVSLLGLEVTGGKYEGKSLLENVDDRVSFVSCWYEDRCLGRLEGAQKVIYNYDRRPLEVFDLDEDPQERRNLAAKLDPGLAERYVAEMKAWKQGKRALYARYKQLISKGYIFNVRPTPEFKLDAQIGRHLKVVGYEMGSAKPGQEATLSLYFEVLKNLG